MKRPEKDAVVDVLTPWCKKKAVSVSSVTKTRPGSGCVQIGVCMYCADGGACHEKFENEEDAKWEGHVQMVVAEV